ncbi:hypothetical protein AL066_04395 [Pseudomonas nunensis]|nr:hypothetical protein AL066_04395 [Pseudomonas nunensis]
MSTHTECHHSPDDQLIAFEDVSWRVTYVLGHQDDIGPTFAKALADRLTINSSNHDVPMLSGDRAINNRHITIKYSSTFHAASFDAHQIDMRCSNVQKLVDRYVLLKVIRSRRWEACRDFEGVKRKLDSPCCKWAEDGDAHEQCLN